MQNFLDQFKSAMASRGLIPPNNLIADGEIHRCDTTGKNGKRDGAYLLHPDHIPAGGFDNWQDGQGWQNWRADIGRTLTAEEEAKNRKRIESVQCKRKKEEKERKDEARGEASRIWNNSLQCHEHPYLNRKKVKSYEAGLYQKNLVLPLLDSDGVLHSLQFITPNGKKYFLPGGAVRAIFSGSAKTKQKKYFVSPKVLQQQQVSMKLEDILLLLLLTQKT